MSAFYYVKMNVGISGGNYFYPVPVGAIKNPKYNKAHSQCAAILEYDPVGVPGVTVISQEEYDQFGVCSISVDKKIFDSGGADSVTVSVNGCNEGDEVVLYDGDTIIDFDYADVTGCTSFNLTSTEKKVFSLRAESDSALSSPVVLVKAV